MKILGVRVDNLSGDKIEQKIKSFLNGTKLRQVVTLNPEIILGAQRDGEFKKIINSSDLNIADGIGLKFAAWRYGENLRHRIAGIDLMWNILRIAENKKMSIFLLTNEDGLSSWRETARVIRRKFPNLKVRGRDVDYIAMSDISNQIKDKDVLFVNFGAPHQEKFINSIKKENTRIKLAVGVGGSFDFISGKVRRAPKWMRKIGMEWLWRLILQPKRIVRICKAVVVFPVRVFINK